MKIATPIITDFDKENIAPWAGNRLIDLRMATLPSKPITRFFLNYKQKKSLGYQKLRPRYEPMDEITQASCEPLCQEGWYFDCETETCKEYRSYLYEVINTFASIEAISHETSYPYTGSGIVQSTVGTPPKYVYAFEETNASHTYDGFYNPSVVETFSNSPKLEAFTHFQEYYYSSNEGDYFEYGIKNLPSYLVGKPSTFGSNSNFIGEFTYMQKSNALTRPGVNLFPDAYDEGALESWMQTVLCGKDYVWIGTSIINWKFKLYGVK